MCALPAGAAAWIEATASSADTAPEAVPYLESVMAWRDAWRPARVRTLLVAESHVAEVPGDASVRVVPLPTVPGRPSEGLPQRYCRLVYCLGYGEDNMCEPTPVKNSGTWQYWDMFGQIGRGIGRTQPRKSTADAATRMAWKLGTLHALQAMGVWLVDASIIALYAPGGQRLFKGRPYERTVRESWSRFVWPAVAHEPLEQIWVIGRGVWSALGGLPEMAHARVVSQPQDRNAERFRSEFAGMVHAIRRESSAAPTVTK